MLVKHAIRTAIASALVGAIFQESNNIAHLAYPAMGLITTLQSSIGVTVKKAWGRLGGSTIGGVIGAWLVVTQGASSATAGLAFVLAALLCEVFQLEAPYSQAGAIASLVSAQLIGGNNPWSYAFSRVIDNWIGVMIGIAVLLIFWSNQPRQTLSDNLIHFLQNSAQSFQEIVASYQSGTGVAVSNRLINEITTRIQESKSLLSQEMYGGVGSYLAQENWSDLLVSEDRLRMHLSTMLKTLKKSNFSELSHQFSEPLTQLAHQVSVNCTALTQVVRSTTSSHSSPFRFGFAATITKNPSPVVPEIRILNEQLQPITDQLRLMRTTEAIRAYSLPEVRQFYVFFHSLTGFIQELDQLTSALSHREVIATQPEVKSGSPWHPVSFDRFRLILKTGIAVWLCLVILNDWLHLPFNYYAIIAAIIAMQPTFGKGIVAGTQRVIVTGIGAVYAIFLIQTLGGTPFTLGLGIALIILTCSYLGLSQGYVAGCILLMLSILSHGDNLNAYIWGRFFETLVGTVIALILSQLFWPNTSSKQLDEGISQTLTKLGSLFNRLIDSYLGKSKSQAAIAQLSRDIQKSLKTHATMQKETQQEPVHNLTAPKAQRKWNLLLSHEKELFQDLEALQYVIQQGTGTTFPQDLQNAIQASAQTIVLSFNQLAASVEQQPGRQKISSLTTFDAIEQALQDLRSSGTKLNYSINEIISLTAVISAMKEIAESLKQLTNDLG